MQYSKRSISTPISEKLSYILCRLLLKRNQKEVFLVLGLLFSQVERTMILKRIGIQYMLLKEIDRNLICEMLKVSSSTVARYAIQLQIQKEEPIKLLKSILLSENMKNILEDMIADILIQPNLYGSHKKIQARYQVAKERKKYL